MTIDTADGSNIDPILKSLRVRFWTTGNDDIDSVSLIADIGRDGVAHVPDSFPDDLGLQWIEVLDSQHRVLERVDPRQVDAEEMTIALSPKVMAAIARPEVETVPMIQRNGRFEFIGAAEADFEGYRLAVAPVMESELRSVFEGLAEAETLPRAIAEHVEQPDIIMTRLALSPVELGFDGRFTFRIPVTKEEIGWAFILSGPRTFAGFRADDPNLARAAEVVIYLPRRSGGQPVIPDEAEDCGCEKPAGAPPIDATEEQILDHAAMFNDDPGPYCKPFSNPERVLGERSFKTILRVETPEIAQAGGIRTKDLPMRLEPMGMQTMMMRMRADLAVERDARELMDATNLMAPEAAMKGAIVKIRPGIMQSFSDTIYKRKAKGRRAPGADNLIDWEGENVGHQSVTVAGGHVLEWRVRWRSNGYSLGSVSHTLTLAPRQIKRIMKIDFARRERARREEEMIVDDEVDQSTERERDYTDAVTSSLSEWGSGESQSHSVGSAFGIGAALPGVVIGGGAAHGSSWSSSSQEAERRAAANEEQHLRDAIRQHGESLRKMESTIITEIEQQESVEGVSEVIANPNYCHALTVVYYDILRHLRVDTELAGLSECLFVPFSVTPFVVPDSEDASRFDVTRLIQHQTALRRYVRDRRLRWVFSYLEDYANGYAGSNVPAGARMDETLAMMRGTLDIRLVVESPLKGDEDARAMEEIVDSRADDRERNAKIAKFIGFALTPFAPLLGIGVAAVSAKLAKRAAEAREELFEREIAGRMARRFVDELELWAGNRRIRADFTLQGGYRKGGTHRVHFQIPPSELSGLRRRDIQNLRVRAPGDEAFRLPAYSIANLKGGRVSFAAQTYRRSLSDGGTIADLLETDDLDAERADASFGDLYFPASSWEKRKMRDEIDDTIEKLVLHLDANRHYYHKVIWWRMDRDELFTLLDGYTLSNSDSRSIASVIEYRPLAVVGNALVFRVARGAFVGVGGYESLEDAFERYADKSRKQDPMRVSLPTGGVYAQALMDECEACEEHFGSTDWVLDRGDILPQELDTELMTSRRAAPVGLTPTNMPDTLINLQNAPAAPAPQGFSDAFNAVQNANAFRDMAGLAGTQENARAAMQNATSLANNFGNMAHLQQMAKLKADAEAGKDLAAFTAATRKAAEKGDISAEARREANEEYAKRKAKDDGPAQAKSVADNAKKILDSEDGGTVASVDKDGATVVHKEPAKKRAPDPDAGVSVVPIPPNQILFMNFKTDSATLRPDHISALEMLVGTMGLDLSGVVHIEGHASTAGSDEHNQELSLDRSNALWNTLHALLDPLNPQPNFSPDFISSTGEQGSYRARFNGIPAVRNAKGEGHRNDPVEKAVLFTFERKVEMEDREFDFFGVKIRISGNFIFIENNIFVSMPDGRVKKIDRSDHSVTNNNVTEETVTTTNTTTKRSQNIIFKNNTVTGDLIILAGDGNDFSKLTRGADGQIENIEKSGGGGTKHKVWRMHFRGPSLENRRTLKTILKDTADILIGIQSSSGGSSLFNEVLGEIVGSTTEQALDILINKLGLGPVSGLLDQVAFGTVKFSGEVKADADPDDKLSGTFSGPGVIVGSQGTAASAVILHNAKYTTTRELAASRWDDQPEKFAEFGYLNVGLIPSVSALKEGTEALLTQIIPFLPVDILTGPVSRAMDAIIEVLSKLGRSPGVRFQAFPDDAAVQFTDAQAGTTGLDLQVIAVAANNLSLSE